jgi:hypothetical protein
LVLILRRIRSPRIHADLIRNKFNSKQDAIRGEDFRKLATGLFNAITRFGEIPRVKNQRFIVESDKIRNFFADKNW